jgi:large subunit ribosomal protein LP1
MATVTTDNTTTTPKINPEQAVAFAALILADEDLSVTPEKLQVLIKAAGVENVEPVWTTLFANALKGKEVKDILTTITTSGPKAETGDSAPQTQRNDGSEGSEERIDVCGASDSEDDDMYSCSLFD